MTDIDEKNISYERISIIRTNEILIRLYETIISFVRNNFFVETNY